MSVRGLLVLRRLGLRLLMRLDQSGKFPAQLFLQLPPFPLALLQGLALSVRGALVFRAPGLRLLKALPQPGDLLAERFLRLPPLHLALVQDGVLTFQRALKFRHLGLRLLAALCQAVDLLAELFFHTACLGQLLLRELVGPGQVGSLRAQPGLRLSPGRLGLRPQALLFFGRAPVLGQLAFEMSAGLVQHGQSLVGLPNVRVMFDALLFAQFTIRVKSSPECPLWPRHCPFWVRTASAQSRTQRGLPCASCKRSSRV